MFEPDILLPEQFRALHGKVLSSEQRLLFAILEDAIHCYQVYASALRPRDRKVFHEAEAWFESLDTEWFFSFENVCAILGLSADYVRRAMRRWKAEHVDAATRVRTAQLAPHYRFDSFPRTRSL